MAGPLRRVAMRRPGAILDADPQQWHYAHPLDPESLNHQYSQLVMLLEAAGTEILWLPEGDDQGEATDGLADSIFTYDPSFVSPAGAILMRPGKALREGEVELHRSFYEAIDLPIVGEIAAPGLAEGGDCFWLDDETLAVGLGFRTNRHGADQLTEILARQDIAVETFDLPAHHGPDACLHLLSIVNPLDVDLALIHSPLVPVGLLQRMTELGYSLIDVPPYEFDSSSGLNLNVLPTGPRTVIAIDGFPQTRQAMEEAGCQVSVFPADQLCLPCEGGPTCLTRPILRT